MHNTWIDQIWLILRFVLIAAICFVVICFFPWNVVPTMGQETEMSPWKGLILEGLSEETIFPVLTNVLIAIYTLAVTAFIFLATALMERRERYEQKTIHYMLKGRTRELLWLTLFSAGCIVGCIAYERVGERYQCLNVLLVEASFVVLIYLLLYSVRIINYEKEMIKWAQKRRKNIEKELKCSNVSGKVVTLQKLGDISIVVERLLENHVREYHYIQRNRLLQELTDEEFVKNTALSRNTGITCGLKTENRIVEL